MVKVIGVLKKVNLSSKVSEDNRVIHNAQISIEITEGEKDIQSIADNLKEHIEIAIKNVQPRLEMNSHLPYKDDADQD